MIRGRANNNMRVMQLHGKQLVDKFRKFDDSLGATLDAAETDAEDRTTHGIEVVLLTFLVAGAAVVVVFARLSVQYERTSTELVKQTRVADLLQNAFMRSDLPKLPNADLSAIYVPAGLEAKVGGDWYDAFTLSKGHVLLSLGDVAGHGVEAAVIMSRVRQAILSVGVIERNPAAVLTLVNEILLLQNSTMVTAVCVFVDIEKHLITYSTAGHPPIVLAYANGDTQELPYWGPPLGAIDDVTYRTFTAKVEPGSTLFLYTDGLLEQSKNLEYGQRRLIDAITMVQKAQPENPAEALRHAILAEDAPRDDVAILTMSFRYKSGARGRNADEVVAKNRTA
jgi:phosphoserine phosphatase RsbU/P